MPSSSCHVPLVVKVPGELKIGDEFLMDVRRGIRSFLEAKKRHKDRTAGYGMGLFAQALRD